VIDVVISGCVLSSTDCTGTFLSSYAVKGVVARLGVDSRGACLFRASILLMTGAGYAPLHVGLHVVLPRIPLSIL
jgi:hypothetical protein